MALACIAIEAGGSLDYAQPVCYPKQPMENGNQAIA
jgi:uncharacterized protein (DUF779 family)